MDIIKAVDIILDFVERYNKQDKEVDVAEAAQFLDDYIHSPN